MVAVCVGVWGKAEISIMASNDKAYQEWGVTDIKGNTTKQPGLTN